ncbi:MAG: hypothetical protein ACODAD_00610 [Planctomycetota bacterium]
MSTKVTVDSMIRPHLANKTGASAAGISPPDGETIDNLRNSFVE